MKLTFEVPLAVEKKSKPYSHTHIHTRSSHDHEKDTKFRYFGKKDHYKKEY